MELGEVYSILGVPVDEETGMMTADEASAMHTPFSALGIHFFSLNCIDTFR